MATLKDYFDTDFTHVLNASRTFQFQSKEGLSEVNTRIHFDFDSNTKYLSCYIQAHSDPLGVFIGLLNNLDKVLEFANGVEIQSGLPGEEMMSSKALKFSGRIFIYSETTILDTDFNNLSAEALPNGIHLHYRGPKYAEKRSSLEKPLAFISHDTRDKDTVARPIAIGLTKLMCPVWFDEFSLNIGDRLRESIEKGIRESKKCILILSSNFLENPGWTKTEFNSIFTRELVEGTDFLLPVWYGVSKRQIFDYSPTLVNRLGANWETGETEVVRRLYKAIVSKKGT